MVGPRTLDPLIEVRILAPEPIIIPGSSNGRTSDSGSDYRGSNP